jgi:GTP-binding protein HflX
VNDALTDTLISREGREKLVLVGVALGGDHVDDIDSSLDELSQLVDTAGADEVARVVQRRDRPDPATYIGKGKAEELREVSLSVDSDTVVFDNELSPAQQFNLEKLLGRTAIDRTAVILDIFAQNAHSQEGKAQVELALLQYRLPRLRGKGTKLSQQAGGMSAGAARIGSRGPGETQLEVDRRRLVRRIHKLQGELKTIGKHRDTQRKSRRRSQLGHVAIVGYTNAGKSTLLRRFTEADVLIQNQLFSTLDPTTRRFDLSPNRTVLLTDTVGFVKKLPHQLVEAFRSTLEEVTEATLLLHIVDASRDTGSQIDAVTTVLAEIGASEQPAVIVMNKTDLLDEVALDKIRGRHPDAVFVSANRGSGLDVLVARVEEELARLRVEIELLIPFDRGDVVARVHETADVLEESYAPEGTRIVARVPREILGELQAFSPTA